MLYLHIMNPQEEIDKSALEAITQAVPDTLPTQSQEASTEATSKSIEEFFLGKHIAGIIFQAPYYFVQF